MGKRYTPDGVCRKPGPGEIMKKAFWIVIFIFWTGCMPVSKHGGPATGEAFYPPLPQRPRLQFLKSISGQHDLDGKRNAFIDYLIGEPQDALLGKPYDVCATKGKIFILDRMNKNLAIIDLEKGSLSFLNDRGNGRLADPAGIWVSSGEVKYIADMKHRQVLVFDRDNAFLRSYGSAAIFEKPVDVAVDAKYVFVVDLIREQLVILDKASGAIVRAVGDKGDFFKPSHVTVSPAGEIFVTDALHFVVKKITADGDITATIGFHSNQAGGFARPKGIAVDRDNRLYVVDAAFENVQIFDELGSILLYFGGPGGDPGCLYLPAGIAIDYDNVVYFQKYAHPEFKLDYLVHVANMFGEKPLNIFGFGHWITESIPDR